jgi:hypothetical protein
MEKNSDPGSEINIPDPQHWIEVCNTVVNAAMPDYTYFLNWYIFFASTVFRIAVGGT